MRVGLNMDNGKKTVIVGSGLSALMLARMIQLYRDPDASIVIVERDEVIGGQYGGFDYGPNGYFDIGMHIYYESNIPEIDSLFTDLLPEDEWHILEGNYKDIQGLFYNGKLQTGTPSVDLRSLPEEKWKKYVAEIFFAIKNNEENKAQTSLNAYEVLKSHFGNVIADEIFVPILEKLYLTHPENLDELATLFTPLSRVALFDKEIMLDLMRADGIRDRISYPDQLTMPPYRKNEYRGFYPKKFGMFRVLEKLKLLLEDNGVQFVTSSTITNLDIEEKTVKSITISGKNINPAIINVKEIFWTAGLPSLAVALKINLSDLINDKKHTEAMYVNILFDKEPQMEKLYYFYCFDKGYRSFRVTNYSNYCPSAAGERGYPVCVEYWTQPNDSTTEVHVTSVAITELKSFGIIDESYTVLFSKVEKLGGVGFPLPSIKNIENMKEIGGRINKCAVKNLIPTGVLSGKNVFFLKDILADTYKKVCNKKE
jgi:protoporphyrinogen oxidase